MTNKNKAPAPPLMPDGVREEIDCPFCGSDSFVPVTGHVPDILDIELEHPYNTMKFQMVRCESCDLRYQRLQPSFDDIGMFYDSKYFCYVPMSERGKIVNLLVNLTTQGLIRKLKRYAPSDDSKLLDYGCGSGPWLQLLRDAGAPWQLAGTEIDAGLVTQVQEQGFEATVCTERDLLDHFPSESLGIFFMNHVIEHVRNPLDFLRKIFAVLEPGGIVYGQTPNCDCLEARLFGDYWTQWHLPQHLVIFTKETMRKHAEAAGFEVVELSSSPSAATQWASSTLWAWSNKRGRKYRATKEPLHSPLTLLFAPLSLLQSKVTNTSHMDFVLRKPVETATAHGS